ncbi:MAG: SLBB domain-containing protein [Sedimentisphaerales bacterium]|nr:SLBB domain-containing protein [Sedimentisphaerales bacterium]
MRDGKPDIDELNRAAKKLDYPKVKGMCQLSLFLVSNRFSIEIFIVFVALLLASIFSAAKAEPSAEASSLEKDGVDSGVLSPQKIDDIVSSLDAQSLTQKKGGEKTEAAEVTAQGSAPVAAVTAAMSPIEQLLAGELAGEVSGNLTQFGYDVFQRQVSTFAPVQNVPVAADYVVGPGDAFTVTLWGRANAQYIVEIDRNGQIVLPEVGVINVSGMKLAQMENYIQDQISRKETDFKMAVTMGRLRTIKVFVVGEAQTPGSYTISSLSTVINALFAAGGPSKNGSMRDIRLMRGNQKAIHIDLYDFLLGGDKSNDIRLADGDTIFIPIIGPVVGVAGNVKRPAIYEMAKPMILSEAIDLAGGVNYAGWLQQVQVERVENHKRRIVADFNVAEQSNMAHQESAVAIQDGDLIKIFAVSPFEQNVVRLVGHVGRPGKYELKPGMWLRDILKSYDTLQPQPDLEYGEIERLVEPDFHPIVIPFNVGKLLDGDESENIELARFDTIRVFRWDERVKRSVSVSGLVFRPGDYRLIPGMKVSDLIDAAGGFMRKAYLRRAEVSRRHISQSGIDTEESGVQTEEIAIDLEKALAGVPEHDIALQDGDSLLVRPIDERIKRSVSVSGLVFEPGKYPLTMDMKVSDLIDAAGGLMKNAYLRTAEITRRHISQSGMQTEKININLEKALAKDTSQDIELQDYDYLVVRAIPELEFDRAATISGQVRFPGVYPVTKGESLSSLIERAGGFTDKAYLRGAVFTRESAKAIQKQRLDELINELEESVLTTAEKETDASLDEETNQAQAATMRAKRELLVKLRNAKIDGRVVVKLAAAEKFKGSKYDLELEKGDSLLVPEMPGIINIVGDVYNPTSLLYEKDKTVAYYLQRVGGPTRDADSKHISVIKADGSVVSIAQKNPDSVYWDSESHQWNFGGFMSIRLNPGDTIVVPRKMDQFLWLKTTKDLTQILFQAALTAGVIIAL